MKIGDTFDIIIFAAPKFQTRKRKMLTFDIQQFQLRLNFSLKVDV